MRYLRPPLTQVAKLVDAQSSGGCAFGRAGSSPLGYFKSLGASAGVFVPETRRFVARSKAPMPTARNLVTWFMETHLRDSQPTTHGDKTNVLWWWPDCSAESREQCPHGQVLGRRRARSVLPRRIVAADQAQFV